MDGSDGTVPTKSGHLARVEVEGYVWKSSERFGVRRPQLHTELTRFPSCMRCAELGTDEMAAVKHNVDWRKYTLSPGRPWGKVEFVAATWKGETLEDVDADHKLTSWYARRRMRSTGSDLESRDPPRRDPRFSSNVLPRSADFTVGGISRTANQTDTAHKVVQPVHGKTPVKRRHKLASRLLRWFTCGQLPAEPEVKTFIRDAVGDSTGSRCGGKSARSSSSLYRARHQAFMQRVKDSMSGDEDFRTSIPSPTFFDYPALGLSQESLFIVDETDIKGKQGKEDLDSAKIEDSKKTKTALSR